MAAKQGKKEKDIGLARIICFHRVQRLLWTCGKIQPQIRSKNDNNSNILLDLEVDKVPESKIEDAIICLKNGGTVAIVDNVSPSGQVNPPETKEVVESFKGPSSVENFRNFVQKCKENGRDSFNAKQK